MNNDINFIDKEIISLKKRKQKDKLRTTIGENNILIENKIISLVRENLFENKFSIKLPSNFEYMEDELARIKYFSNYRPQIIKWNEEESATIGFSQIFNCNMEMKELCKEVYHTIFSLFPQNVFYNRELIKFNDIEVYWFDYKSFAIDIDLYNILFMFKIKNDLILGNFNCIFDKFEDWNLAMLKMLETIYNKSC